MSGERLTPSEAWNEGFETGLRTLAFQLKQDLKDGYEINENEIDDTIDTILELGIYVKE